MFDPGTSELVGTLIINIIISLLVALLAIKKSLGYGKAFVISFLAGIVFILLSVPFDSLTANIICAIIFLFLPKKNRHEGYK